MGGHIPSVCKWVSLATLTLIHCFPSNISCKHSATACLIKLWGLPVPTKTITWCCPTVLTILIVSAVVSPLRAGKEISGSISSSLSSSSMSCSSSDSFQQSIKNNGWHLWPNSFFITVEAETFSSPAPNFRWSQLLNIQHLLYCIQLRWWLLFLICL